MSATGAWVLTAHLPGVGPAEVEPGNPLLIGRTEEAGLALLHPSVSRGHARVEWRKGRAEIVDLASRNGTFVNDARVDSAALVAGMNLRVGEVRIDVREVQEPAECILSSTDLSVAAESLAAVLADYRPTTETRLQVLLQVSQTLSSPERLDVVLERIVDLAFRVLPIERAVLLLLDDEDELRPRLSRPAATGGWSRTVAQQVLRDGRAVLFADTGDLGAASVVLQGIRASMAAPLRGRTRTLGVLYTDTRQSDSGFRDEDLPFLVAFAHHAASAIENALLLEALEREASARAGLSRFFPAPMVAALMAGSIETVDTEVTAMFMDIVGYTELASRMAPRDVIAMLNGFFPTVASVVFQSGGVLEKYVGDAVLAVWGAPRAGPEDADNALDAARGILRAAAARNASPSRVGPPLELHIGLHSGPVAAGNIGSPEYLQYATIGDTTNIASRVCGAAAGGEIVCTDAMWSRLRRRPDGVLRDGVLLKGRSGEHRCWVVTAAP